LDGELSQSYLQHWIGAERAFRDDTLPYICMASNLDALESMLVDMNRRLKTRQGLEGKVQNRLSVGSGRHRGALHFSRCCESCPGTPGNLQRPSRPQCQPSLAR
jgi:hypothetical protein